MFDEVYGGHVEKRIHEVVKARNVVVFLGLRVGDQEWRDDGEEQSPVVLGQAVESAMEAALCGPSGRWRKRKKRQGGRRAS
jgi:hypothetical protein